LDTLGQASGAVSKKQNEEQVTALSEWLADKNRTSDQLIGDNGIFRTEEELSAFASRNTDLGEALYHVLETYKESGELIDPRFGGEIPADKLRIAASADRSYLDTLMWITLSSLGLDEKIKAGKIDSNILSYINGFGFGGVLGQNAMDQLYDNMSEYTQAAAAIFTDNLSDDEYKEAARKIGLKESQINGKNITDIRASAQEKIQSDSRLTQYAETISTLLELIGTDSEFYQPLVSLAQGFGMTVEGTTA